MGFYENWLIIFIIFSSFLLLSMADDSRSYDPESLQELFHSYANETLSKHHTGHFYNLSLPSNSSGMQVSVIRLRNEEFFVRGVNFSSLRIPPRVVAVPFVRRIAIINDNFGNWSSYYYQVPNYSLVAPVIGFSAYDASNSSNLSDDELSLFVSGNPISILFPDIVSTDKNLTLKCVKFGVGMSVEFSNMTKANECLTKGPGHFSVVAPFKAPEPPPPPQEKEEKKKKKEESSRKWWVIGFVGGFFGLVLLIIVGVAIFNQVRRKMIEKMENESEKAVALETIWIGRSRMPSASTIRTQPTLEQEYVP